MSGCANMCYGAVNSTFSIDASHGELASSSTGTLTSSTKGYIKTTTTRPTLKLNKGGSWYNSNQIKLNVGGMWKTAQTTSSSSSTTIK